MALVPIPKPVKKKQKPTKQQQQKNPTTFLTENQSEQVENNTHSWNIKVLLTKQVLKKLQWKNITWWNEMDPKPTQLNELHS